ncbi:hypothetical protein TNCV_3159491 [Trichonephila clavipes]|nr:hypothetical protein TNCV_3159491 [Trichonephila clavipes]
MTPKLAYPSPNFYTQDFEPCRIQYTAQCESHLIVFENHEELFQAWWLWSRTRGRNVAGSSPVATVDPPWADAGEICRSSAP